MYGAVYGYTVRYGYGMVRYGQTMYTMKYRTVMVQRGLEIAYFALKGSLLDQTLYCADTSVAHVNMKLWGNVKKNKNKNKLGWRSKKRQYGLAKKSTVFRRHQKAFGTPRSIEILSTYSEFWDQKLSIDI